MLRRFTGVDGKRVLTEAIRVQKIVAGDPAAAALLAVRADVGELQPGDVLIQQGAADNDLFLILSGALTVRINGRTVATRTAGTHVGEMALIDTGARRSATVIAREPTVVCKISEPDFSAAAQNHPALWRAVAIEVGERLRQRSGFIKPPNDAPTVFIGSSREALPIAQAVQSGIACPEFIVRPWTDGVFGASHFPIDDLEQQLSVSDFAVLVAAPDDFVESRGARKIAPRDNVVFELGLFMGGLSRRRTFIVAPNGTDMKIPTDLLGLTQLRYDPATSPIDVTAACSELKKTILQEGPR